MEPTPVADIAGARVLAKLGDSVTTDHISPAGAIKADTPAGKYLTEHGVERRDFNSYGSRRGNHEVMIRGTFANIRLRNQIAPGTEGGYTRDFTAGRRPGLVHLRRLAATTRPPASRWSSWRARSTAPARPATGPPRAPRCSASRPSSPSRTSASTARTSSAWASCRCSSRRAPRAESLGLTGEETFSFTGVDRAQRRHHPAHGQGHHRHRRRVRRGRPHRHPR